VTATATKYPPTAPKQEKKAPFRPETIEGGKLLAAHSNNGTFFACFWAEASPANFPFVLFDISARYF
jgi:hypothetical protein